MSGYVVVAGPKDKAKELTSQNFCLSVVPPPTLKCGGFESQILSTDSLTKLDTAVEGALRRIERVVVEADKDKRIDKNNYENDDGSGPVPLVFEADERPLPFTVKSRNWCSTTEYLRNFEWDRIKFGQPSVQETAQEIQKVVDAMDSNFRAESQKYLDKKNRWLDVAPAEDTGPFSFVTKDLVDVLIPDKVTEGAEPSADDDFIYTANITTVVVVVPTGLDNAFIEWHDGCVAVEKVVPNSARKLTGAGVDKDDASLYRVLVMKSGQSAFTKACREAGQGWTVCDFVYRGRKGYEQLEKNRTDFKKDFEKSHERLLELGLTTWSDLLQCWTHLKLLRAAVEGNLRYGAIPSFAFVSVPSDPAPFRKQLAGTLGTDREKSMEDAEVDDYYPYVSVAMDP